VSFLAAFGAEPQPLPLQVEDEEPALAREPKIAVTSRSRLDVAMREGSYVELPPGLILANRAPPRAVGPFTLALRHQLTGAGAGAVPATYMTTVVVRLARTEPALLDESYGPVPCSEPVLKVFQLSSSIIVVERACRLAGSGGAPDDLQVGAWVCDATKRLCR
jgi:hypothetical protein